MRLLILLILTEMSLRSLSPAPLTERSEGQRAALYGTSFVASVERLVHNPGKLAVNNLASIVVLSTQKNREIRLGK